MQIKYRILLFLLGTITLLLSCQEKVDDVPEGIIEKSVFVDVLLDMQLLEAHLNEPRVEQVFVRDSVDNYNKEILEKYAITKNDFRSTMKYYSSKPGELQAIYETVLGRLSEMEADLVDVKIDASKMTIIGKHQIATTIALLPMANIYQDSSFTELRIKDSLFKFLLKNPTYLDTLHVNLASFQKNYNSLTYRKQMYYSLKAEIVNLIIKNKKN